MSDLGRSTPMALRDRCAVFAVYVHTEIIIATVTIHLRTYRRITYNVLAHVPWPIRKKNRKPQNPSWLKGSRAQAGSRASVRSLRLSFPGYPVPPLPHIFRTPATPVGVRYTVERRVPETRELPRGGGVRLIMRRGGGAAGLIPDSPPLYIKVSPHFFIGKWGPRR